MTKTAQQSNDAATLERGLAAFRDVPPGKLMGRGHAAGDLVAAYDWDVLEERPGYLRLDARLPAGLRNPRGQLFGGFAPTIVDLVAIHTARAGERRADAPARWFATANMRIDYLEPVIGDRIEIRSELVNRRRRSALVQTRLCDPAGGLLVHALTVLRETG